jgi:hypothetical protein
MIHLPTTCTQPHFSHRFRTFFIPLTLQWHCKFIIHISKKLTHIWIYGVFDIIKVLSRFCHKLHFGISTKSCCHRDSKQALNKIL